MARFLDRKVAAELYAAQQRARKPTTTHDNTSPVERKYHNEPTEDGHASRHESKRARELYLLQSGGYIRDLSEQVPFVLIPTQRDTQGNVLERAVTYIADFVYVETSTNQRIVEDAKGAKTPLYILKRKLMLFLFGIVIKET